MHGESRACGCDLKMQAGRLFRQRIPSEFSGRRIPLRQFRPTEIRACSRGRHLRRAKRRLSPVRRW